MKLSKLIKDIDYNNIYVFRNTCGKTWAFSRFKYILSQSVIDDYVDVVELWSPDTNHVEIYSSTHFFIYYRNATISEVWEFMDEIKWIKSEKK